MFDTVLGNTELIEHLIFPFLMFRYCSVYCGDISN